MKHLKSFENHAGYEAYINGGDVELPNVSYCVYENEVHYHAKPHDYSKDYLTTTALENGTISFIISSEMGTDYINSISYSKDNGDTWVTTYNTNGKDSDLYINVDVLLGESILWKGDAQKIGANEPKSHFYSEIAYNVSGNVMSLLYGDAFYGEKTLTENYQLAGLFSSNRRLIDASNLSLPATTLSPGCYSLMFYACVSMTTAPTLSSLSLASACYSFMFNTCLSLTYIKAMFTDAPSPATTMLWVSDVSATGTFVKNSDATWDVEGPSGIPSGWTVETASA